MKIGNYQQFLHKSWKTYCTGDAQGPTTNPITSSSNYWHL